MNETVRLDKYLANLGVCSRRAVDQLLREKKVTINGRRILESGARINPEKDDIRVSGAQVKKPELKYYLLNKPKGFISTTSDEFGRKSVVSLVKTSDRLYPVGRLDKDTTGLIILTNDGELTNFLTHPRYHIEKTYRLTILGNVSGKQITGLRNGVKLNDGVTSPADVNVVRRGAEQSILNVTIHEGRNRQIRRMCGVLGINLMDLERIAIGGIKDENLKPGSFRMLSTNEIKSLKDKIL